MGSVISLSKPTFTKEELQAVKTVLDSGWVAGQGPENHSLAIEIAEYINVDYAIPVNNCTAGLHLALMAVGVGTGDEVVVSDFTYPATGHAVMYCGATPRFADVDLDSYNVSPDSVEEKINSKTKAIVVVHALGKMVDIQAMRALANEHSIFLIEDAACALGATNNNINAGQIGDISVFSMHARKNVTSGEGGVIVTNNKAYADYVRSMSCFGIESAKRREASFAVPKFTQLGYNYKLSDINAAIARVQLRNYEKVLEKRFQLVEKYVTSLRGVSRVFEPTNAGLNRHVFQTYGIRLDSKINRNELIVRLKDVGVQTQIGTFASHIQPVYQSRDKCPNSLRLFESVLALPLHNGLTFEEIEMVVNRLKTELSRL